MTRSWPQRHLEASLLALGALPGPFFDFVHRPEVLPDAAPPGTWKIRVEDGPWGRGALVLDTWEGDALAAAILRLVQALPGAYDLDAAGRVHLGTPGRFVRAFGFLLRDDAPPLLRFELREKQDGTGVCDLGALIARQPDLDRSRPVGPELGRRASQRASRAEVWIPDGARPWLGAVVGDERIIDRPGAPWTGRRLPGEPERWRGPGGLWRSRGLG